MRFFKIFLIFLSIAAIVFSIFIVQEVDNSGLGEGLKNIAIMNVSIAIGLGAISLNIKSIKERKSVIKSVLLIIFFGVISQIFSMLGSSEIGSEYVDGLRIYIVANTIIISVLIYYCGVILLNSLNKKVISSYEAETTDSFY